MTTYNKHDPKSIQKMFGSIAKQYDRTNAILSLQMHRYWNRQLILMTLSKKAPKTYLDLCCGTGEISLNYLKNCSTPCEAYLLDFCPEMLIYAQERANKLHPRGNKISYLQADAQEIPLLNESIDCATMAYGIRNIADPQKCFREVFRVLRSEGKIGILELTQPQNPLLKIGHSLYLNTVVPLMGKMITSNREAYQYLCNSIKAFVRPLELEKMLKEAGFKKTQIKPIQGGIATILLAEKD
jgi:demethylmenaquinone methyltransferase / 2-methoxy-6-polyprenyl-1,4-benzoquinol methylase